MSFNRLDISMVTTVDSVRSVRAFFGYLMAFPVF